MKKKISLISIGIMTFLINFTIVNAENSFSGGTTVACGFEYMPDRLPGFTSGLYNIVKLLVPVILIIMGMIDFTKAMMASEEKKMKDAQKSFITRLIASVIIFLIMAVVQFVFNSIDTGSSYKNGFINCMNCLLSNDDRACKSGETDSRKKCEDYDLEECPNQDEYGNYCKSFTQNGSEGTCKKINKCSDLNVSQCNSEVAKRLSCAEHNGKCMQNCNTMGLEECKQNSEICAYTPVSGSNTPSCHYK